MLIPLTNADVAEIDNIPGCEVDFPDPNNLMVFFVNVTPSDGLYTGATFKFQVTIPPSYPYDPPKVECQTLVYHPNIDWEGHVCLNILRADWMPVLNLGSVLFGLVTLFLVRFASFSFAILFSWFVLFCWRSCGLSPPALPRSPTRTILSTRRRRSS